MNELTDVLLERLRNATNAARAEQAWRTIEDRYTPRELHASLPIFDGLSGLARLALDKSDILRELRQKPSQDYRRRTIAADVVLYGGPPQLRRKSLIIALCGRSHRLMTCWSLFLQFLPASRFDVLILADRTNEDFYGGVRGYAPDLLSLTRRVIDDVNAEAYDRVYCYGTSTGGFPALRFGLLMGAYRSIAVGGLQSWPIHRLTKGGVIQAFDPLCACNAQPLGHLVCIHAANEKRDSDAARKLQRVLKVSRVPVAGSDKHNVVYNIYLAGKLSPFYAKIFDFAPR